MTGTVGIAHESSIGGNDVTKRTVDRKGKWTGLRFLATAATLTTLLVVPSTCSQEREHGHSAAPAVRQPDGSGLEMKARAVQETMVVDAPIYVEISVRNESDSIVEFQPILEFGGHLQADITDSTGRLLPLVASIDPPSARAVRLAPGEAFLDTVDIRCAFPEDPCMAPYDLHIPGRYQVALFFMTSCADDNCKYLEAEPFRFRVISTGK